MQTAFSIVVSLLVFGVIITIHEFGHFVMARAMKVRVHAFAVGMGPKILKRTSPKSGTEYSLRAIPFGGFCQMEGLDEDEDGNITGFDSPTSFHSKKVWQRMLIVTAGPLMNIALGVVLLVGIFSAQPFFISNEVAQFSEGAKSHATGLEIGDVFLNIGGFHVSTMSDVQYGILRDDDGIVDITVRRAGQKVLLRDVQFTRYGEEGEVGEIDIDFKVYRQEKTVLTTAGQVFRMTESVIRTTWYSVFDIITGRFGINQVYGPVGSVEMIGQSASQGAESLLMMVVLLSMNIAVVNFLPIPGLDGGQIILLLIEAVRRKPIDPKRLSLINAVGLGLIVVLGIALFFNDIMRIIGR